MSVTNALAGIAVSDFAAALRWYERLLDRPADSQPMEGDAEWHFADGGSIQVFSDAKRAGSSSVTLTVTSLDELLRALQAKGITIGERTTGTYVKTAIVRDPDGNQLVFAEPVKGTN